MNEGYFLLNEDDEQTGPYSFNELVNAGLDLHSRILSPKSEFWEDACDLPEFYSYFASVGIYLPTGDNLASFGWRLLAYGVDFIILNFLTSFMFTILASYGIVFKLQTYQDLLKMPVSNMLLLQLITSGTLIVYNAVCEASPMEGSIGKRVCGLVVVDVDGVGQSFLNALLRSMGKAVSILLFCTGFISIFFTEHKQAVHDMLAKTYVVKK